MEDTEGENVYLNDFHLQLQLSSTLSTFISLYNTLCWRVTCRVEINSESDKMNDYLVAFKKSKSWF